MRSIGRFILYAVTAGVVAASTMLAGPAQAGGDGSAAAGQRCYIVLAKLKPGESTSRVVSSECITGNQRRTTTAGTLLMTWYFDADFVTPAAGGIEGEAGGCDFDGYRLSTIGLTMSRNISSYKLWNNCFWFKGWTNFNFTGSTPGWVAGTAKPYIGDLLNDNLRSARLTA